MYRISILTDNPDTGQCLADWTKQFYAEHQSCPVITTYADMENFWKNLPAQNTDGAIVMLPGVAGLNAAEHIRSLLPNCGLIWCSDLDFSLHAFRMRAEYFILAPPGEQDIREGLSVWMEQQKYKQKAM